MAGGHNHIMHRYMNSDIHSSCQIGDIILNFTERSHAFIRDHHRKLSYTPALSAKVSHIKSPNVVSASRWVVLLSALCYYLIQADPVAFYGFLSWSQGLYMCTFANALLCLIFCCKVPTIHELHCVLATNVHRGHGIGGRHELKYLLMYRWGCGQLIAYSFCWFISVHLTW